MTMKTLTKTTLILSSALALAACGGGGGGDATGTTPQGAQSLVYAYPDNNQAEVAPPAPIVLRFTSAVTLANAQGAVTLHEGDASGNAVGADMTVAPDGKGLILHPTDQLKPHTQYTVVVHDLSLKGGTAGDQNITFTTRALQRGPKNLVIESDDFQLARHFPDGGTTQPVMDFSTFRLEFTQPIDPTTTQYGEGPTDTVELVDSNGDLVPATMIVSGPYMTVDPKPAYLTPGEKYTLKLTGDVASTYDTTLTNRTGNGGVDFSFTPKASSPRGAPSILVQKITDSQNDSVLSPLTGQPVNNVPVNGTLLGQNVNKTQASADVRAELGDATVYPRVLPIRIPKGTVLNGSSIDIKIGGHVDAGYDSGAVKMTLLSDATGYLETNPYSTRPDALRIVHLFMDVGITTADPRANGGFTQNLLHIELVGNSEVDAKAGVLNLDAVSVVQPDVLGLEYGYGTLSFQLQSYKDQSAAPKAVADTTPPKVQSWMPGDANHGGDNTDLQKPGDPIIINFDKPIDQQSVNGQVTLYRTDNNGIQEQDADVTVDGAAIVIKPKNPLVYSEETNPISYELQLGNQIADIQGNKYQGSFDQSFSLPKKTERWTPLAYNSYTGDGNTVEPQPETHVQKHSPFILGLYPGYPCVFDNSTTNLGSGIAGRCRGGIPPNNQGQLANDLIPVMSMPANRPIIVIFSRNMDASSISLGKTFKIKKIDLDGNSIGEVPGKLIIQDREIRFWPKQPWENGQTYAYTLVSNDDITSSDIDCTTAICGASKLPLQTQLLANVTVGPIKPDTGYVLINYQVTPQDHLDASAETGGGPDIVQYFKGAPKSNAVLQALKTSPISDINSNLQHDAERFYLDDNGEMNELRTGIGYSHVDPNRFIGYIPDLLFDGRYDAEENGPTSESDPNTQSLTDGPQGGWGQSLDPQGVAPAPNSAKILSTLFGIKNPGSDWPFSGDPVPLQFVGASVGCSYQRLEPVEASQECQPNPFGGAPICHYNQYEAITDICPKDKFTYLTGVLFAEIEPGTDSNGNIQVNIYPGHVVTTSFTTFVHQSDADQGVAPTPSGYQVMRMRYAQNQNGDRINMIPATISEGSNSNPQLSTSLDLYLDAPLLARNLGWTAGFSDVNENFFSYPTHFDLSGEVKFLNDGRMLIEQRNTSAIDFELRGNIPPTYVNLRIPKNGSYLQYISEPIKK